MLRFAFAFMVMAIVTAVLGFGNIQLSEKSRGVSQLLFFMFLLSYAVCFVFGLADLGRKSSRARCARIRD